MPSPKNKAPALKKRKREKLEAELESGPKVDRKRDQIMRNMLAMPPKQQSEMKLGKRGK
ncbi:MAG: hypothetical protein AB7T86_04700 [Xanthobacteraceae bacterium]|uniref:hypothetical protein n=1 Tax=Pseudolabrys sp. TaxID=1960880 RepID=UPI003D0A4A52